jgi:hypothetical protein
MSDSLIVAFTSEKDTTLESQFPNLRDIEIYGNISKILGPGWPVDRTKRIQLPFRSVVPDEHAMPDFSILPKLNLLDTVLDRCAELIKTNKKIYLLWSGGIDSTLVLTSFILSGISSDQLIVVCNNDSIKEYPKFYIDHIRGKFEILSSELLIQRVKLAKVNGIILSCEHGDCMHGQDFGTIALTAFGGHYLWDQPSRENILKLFKYKGMTDQSANCWYDIFMASAINSPRELNTTYDFFWWTTFNWRWQWAIEKIRLRFNHDQEIYTFFSGIGMQKWATVHEQQPISKLSDFKYDFKKLILDYTKDTEYFEQKIKHPSATLFYSVNSYTAMNHRRERMLANEFSIEDYYLADNFISSWLNS